MTAQTTNTDSQITIRRLDLNDGDRRALARLAALDSRPPLAGPVLGAEVDGELLAAIIGRRRRAGRKPVPAHERAPRPAAGADRSAGRRPPSPSPATAA